MTTTTTTTEPVIADEQPHGPYTEKVVCSFMVPGANGRKRKCGAVRYVKPQDLFQVKTCRDHAKAHKDAMRRARATAKRLAEGKPEPKAAKPTKAPKAPKAKTPSRLIAPAERRRRAIEARTDLTADQRQQLHAANEAQAQREAVAA